MKRYLSAAFEAVTDFFSDRGLVWAAALAFYAALSFAPLVSLTMVVAGRLGPGAQQAAIGQFEQLMGSAAGDTLREVVESADQNPASGMLAGIISIAVLLFSATGVFGQLQAALNAIWEVKPKKVDGIFRKAWTLIRTRLLSIGMVASLLFLILLSLAVSSVLQGVFERFGLALLLSQAITFLVYTALFAVMYRLLPDVKLGLTDVLLSAAVTAVLFSIGKYGIGLYLGKAAVTSSYGAAGSLMALLLWLYYASAVVLFGAELCQSLFNARGRVIEPSRHAEKVDGENANADLT